VKTYKPSYSQSAEINRSNTELPPTKHPEKKKLK